MIPNELKLLCLLYEKEELKVSDIAKNLGISSNRVKKLIDVLSKNYNINIGFDGKKRVYYLPERRIQAYHDNPYFWASILIYIFYIMVRTDNQRVKNLAATLLWNFINFYNEHFDKKAKVDELKFFDNDILFLLDDPSLFYVKDMDYNIFIRIKSAISNKSEIRITVIDKHSSGYKRVNTFPIYLAFLRKNWYLVGFSENQYQIFDVNDIKEISLTGRVLEQDIGISVEDAIPELREYIIPSKKYSVLIDISDYVKVYGISFFHPSQKITVNQDKVYMRLEIVNLPILFRWLSSHGKLMKIIEPEIVKQKYIEYLLDIVDSYS